MYTATTRGALQILVYQGQFYFYSRVIIFIKAGGSITDDTKLRKTRLLLLAIHSRAFVWFLPKTWFSKH